MQILARRTPQKMYLPQQTSNDLERTITNKRKKLKGGNPNHGSVFIEQKFSDSTNGKLWI